MLRALIRGAASRGAAARESTTNKCSRKSGWATGGLSDMATGSSSAVIAAGEIMGRACSSATTLCCAAAVGGGVRCAVSCLSSSQPASAEPVQATVWRSDVDTNDEKFNKGEGGNGGHSVDNSHSGDISGHGCQGGANGGGGESGQSEGTDADEEAYILKQQALGFVAGGDVERGEALLAKALSMFETAHGPASLQVASVLSELALVLALQGRIDSADVLLRRTLTIDIEEFGCDGVEIAADLNNFGLILQEQGRTKEAELMFRRCVNIGEQTLQQGSLYLAVWRSNLARVLGLGACNEREKQLEALSLLSTALDVFETDLGPYHPDTLCVMERIACLHIKQSEWRLAEDILEIVVDRYEESVGRRHPRTIAASKNLSEVLGCQGKSWSSRRHLIGAYNGLLEAEEEHGQLHPAVEPALTGLAQLLRQEGRHEEALTLYYRAVQCVDEPRLRGNHPRIAAALNNYAVALMQVGRASEAEPLLWRTADILGAAYGKEHHRYFQGLSNLASALESIGQKRRAEEVLKECVARASEALGHRHPDVLVYAMQHDKIARALGGAGYEGGPEHTENFYRGKGLQAQKEQHGTANDTNSTDSNANVMQSSPRGQQQKQRERGEEAMTTDGREVESIASPAAANTTTTTTTIIRPAPSLVQSENTWSTSAPVYTPVRRMSPPWTGGHREPFCETPPGEE